MRKIEFIKKVTSNQKQILNKVSSNQAVVATQDTLHDMVNNGLIDSGICNFNMIPLRYDGKDKPNNEPIKAWHMMYIPEFKAFYPARKSSFTDNFSLVFVTENMQGKMEFMTAVGTNASDNPLCKKHKEDAIKAGNENCICLYCYVDAVNTQFGNMERNTVYNGKLLSSVDLPLWTLPHFKPGVDKVRFEPFGDCQNVTQVKNMLNIAYANNHVSIGYWTKNYKLFQTAVNEIGKPDNVVMIASCFDTNVEKPYTLANTVKRFFPCFDMFFVVYDTKEDLERIVGVKSNCSGISCKTCKAGCYIPSMHDGKKIKVVLEIKHR